MRYKKRTVEATPRISTHELKVMGLLSSTSPLLTTTPCFFGGQRFWFVCPNPNCRKRVSTLFYCENENRMKCRFCCQLTYESQQCSKNMRRWLQAFRYAERADATFSGLQRVQLFYRDRLTRRAQRYFHFNSQLSNMGVV
jgi:hypothetical protein